MNSDPAMSLDIEMPRMASIADDREGQWNCTTGPVNEGSQLVSKSAFTLKSSPANVQLAWNIRTIAHSSAF
jgi:hypothetical protein